MKLKRIIFMALGFLFTGLAFAGVALPVLPTTPFLLCAAFFFARSSDRWYHYLLNHRIFGQYLRDYFNHEMTIGNKGRTIAVLWIGMGICMWLLRSKLWLVILLGLIACAVTVHLLSLKSVPSKKSQSAPSRADRPQAFRDEADLVCEVQSVHEAGPRKEVRAS